jgi:GH18 family chitinase
MPPSKRSLVVYHTNWSTYDRNFQIDDLPLHAITHLNYCFLNMKQQNDGWIPVFSDPW